MQACPKREVLAIAEVPTLHFLKLQCFKLQVFKLHFCCNSLNAALWIMARPAQPPRGATQRRRVETSLDLQKGNVFLLLASSPWSHYQLYNLSTESLSANWYGTLPKAKLMRILLLRQQSRPFLHRTIYFSILLTKLLIIVVFYMSRLEMAVAMFFYHGETGGKRTL